MSGADIPTYEDLMLPVLRLTAQGQESIADCLPGVQREFGLSSAQMDALRPGGQQAIIVNRAYWARYYMKHAGLIEPVRRGHYRITPAGVQLLAENLARIDRTVLERFTSYRQWYEKYSRTGREGDNADAPETTTAAVCETPEERINLAYRQLDSALAEDLLEQVLSLTPAHFERLIVDLLIAMGYGDGRAEMGHALGKSGDGGIDGVVNEDKLGLDAVYIQAKRYAPENVVGRPALQAFIGSLTGESASKGVFVTTSSFSKEARDYVRRVQQRVVLIDGSRLARLMIDHGVGVRVDKTYVLRSIDANFFDVT